MSYEYFIAKRYMFSKRRMNFITILSIISSLGIMIGVAALIVILSVFNGFGNLVTSILVSFDPHVRITVKNDNYMDYNNELRKILGQDKDIAEYYPFADGKVVLLTEGVHTVVDLKGVEQDTAGTWGVLNRVIYGEKLSPDDNDGILIGLNLAIRLRSLVGDTITAASFNNISQSALTFEMPESKTYVVKGIFETNNKDYDMAYVFTNLSSAQELLSMEGEIHGYEIRLNDISKSDEVKARLEKILNKDDYTIDTWYDLHQDLYTVMQIERWAAYIILSLIIAVATFNVLGSLTMSAIEKKKDVSLLRTMGGKKKSLVKIFMYQGLMIGGAGSIAGAVLGYLICFIQINYKIYPLDPAKYIIDAMPVLMKFSDFLWIMGMSFVLSFLATLYPARRAANSPIIESIKWE
jgi:lipoprotein-releasing system permease protein